MATFRIAETTYWNFEAKDEAEAKQIFDNFEYGINGLGLEHSGYEVSGPYQVTGEDG